MLKVLRRLFGGGPSGSASATKAARRSSATSDVLAKRSSPIAERNGSRSAGDTAGIDFDPYNTGAFDRSASWERIGKRNL